MARPKGAKNRASQPKSYYATLAPTERVKFIANLIVDRILEDQQTGGKLLLAAEEQSHARPIHS